MWVQICILAEAGYDLATGGLFLPIIYFKTGRSLVILK